MAIPVLDLEFNLHNSIGFSDDMEIVHVPPERVPIDVGDDKVPPEPEETIVTRLLEKGKAGDEMKQNFVSAAVLQANESEALLQVLQDGKIKYVRSPRMPSMGFE